MSTPTFERRATRSDSLAKTLLIPPSRKVTGKRPRLSQESATTKLLADKVATEVRIATAAAATALANEVNARRVAILDAATDAAHAADLVSNKEVIDGLHATVHTLNTEAVYNKEVIDGLRTTAGSLHAKLACHEEVIAGLQASVGSLSAKVDCNKDVIGGLNTTTGSLNAELACNKRIIDDLKATVGSLNSELVRDQEKYKRDKNELVTFATKLKAEAVDLIAKVDDKSHKLSQYKTWEAGLNKAHAELMNQVHELDGDNRNLTVANAKLRFGIESLQKTMTEYTDNIGFEDSELRQKCEKLRVESDGRQKECVGLRRHSADVCEENNVLRSRVKQLQNAAAIRPASWASPEPSGSYGASLASAV